MIVGRHSERGRIDGVLASLREGRGHTLVVRGEAGIGKTALLSYAAARARGMRVLRARGVETETDLAFSGLHELVLPLLVDLEGIPRRQAEALRGALALGPPVADRFAVHAGTLTLLAAAAERRPVLALVDDLHWLDTATTEAIAFAARRLTDDPVAMILTTREPAGDLLSVAASEELRLDGLDVEDAVELLTDARIAHSAIAELVRATGGNPLALIELTRVLDEPVLRGQQPLPEPLPTTPSIERAFRRRAGDLSEDVGSAVLVAAAFGGGDLGPIKRALAATGIEAGEALETAEAAGLIRMHGSRFEFVHPLARSAFYEVAAPAERRAAHAALAEALPGDDEADRRAWHLGAATIGPDEAVASALESSADAALARGGFSAASAASERAAELSEPGEARARRLAAAAHAAQLAGAGERALHLLQQALQNTTDAVLRAEIQSSRGFISFWRGDFDLAKNVFTEATRIESVDPARAAVIYAELTGPCFMRGDPAGFIKAARRARELAEPDGGFTEFMALSHWGRALMYAGRVAEARPYLLRGAAIAESDPGALADPVWAAIAAGNLGLLEEDDRARALLNHLVSEARATSSFGVLTLLLPFLSSLERDTGDWYLARALAVEAVDLSRDTGQSHNLLDGLVECAFLAAGQGREGECRTCVAEALDLAHSVRSLPDIVYARTALGLLYLGLGRSEQAIGELEPCVFDLLERGIGEPQLVAAVPELVEAYIRVGQTVEAAKLLADFERLASNSGLAAQLAASCRCRGLLVSNEQFEATLRAGLVQCDRVPRPFERARIELCLGERLRRARRRVDARKHLRSSIALFEQLGAACWVEKARSELRASGETIRVREPASRDALTPQELKVALVVAEGLSNREAATALFLSPKTIEAHLGRVYRKLGIRSRSELARAFAPAPQTQVEALTPSVRTADS